MLALRQLNPDTSIEGINQVFFLAWIDAPAFNCLGSSIQCHPDAGIQGNYSGGDIYGTSLNCNTKGLEMGGQWSGVIVWFLFTL